MNALEYNWTKAKELGASELTASLFELLQSVGREIQFREPDDPELLSVVPRMLDLIEQREDVTPLRDLISAAARSLGLWNYIDKRHADSRERLLAEALTYPELGNITLHREQTVALNILLSGTNLILSAPTSFGKSILIDALLVDGRYDRVAVVLPTIALLDEFRRRLLARFGDRYQILMHHTERAVGGRAIFLGTQERLINRGDLGNLDLLVVDEFYKLDPARKDDRSITLNAAVYQLLKRAKQFFFLGPNIQSVQVSAGARWRFEFLKTRFSTVAVDTIDLTSVSGKQERLVEEIFNKKNWPALVFVSSPERANDLSSKIVEHGKMVGDARTLAQWIETNYGGSTILSQAVKVGVGLHHGRIPRSLASRFVWAFNKGYLPILICTSTLIEGVNTAAKSVLIFDKKINKENYDFFTFSNIRGRAGRLGQHHVGRVLLFNSPPDAESVDVTAPLFTEPEDAPEELVVHFAEEEVTEEMSERIDDVAAELGVSIGDLKKLSLLGLDNLRALKSAASETGALLAWAGHPGFSEIERCAQVICKVKTPSSFGVRSARQLAFYIDKLRRLPTLKEFFAWHSSTFTGKRSDWDNVVKFLRACEYSLPEYFSALELFVAQRYSYANYKYFIGGLVRWFRPTAVKELEEQGIPAQISERFARADEPAAALEARLKSLADSQTAQQVHLSRMEREWIIDAVPRTVGANGLNRR
jgi:hypothetical protein